MYEDAITQYIENVLQREPMPGEVDTWTAVIENNGQSLEDVRDDIINSAEAVQGVYPVVLAYQAIYGRVPDADGLHYWTGVYESNLHLDNPATGTVNEAMVAVLKAFVDPDLTPEFTQRYGADPTSAQFVAAAYHNVLGRAADQGGLNYWETRYNEIKASYANSGMSDHDINVEVRAQILEQFVDSSEYVDATGHAVDSFLADAADGVDGAYSGSLWGFDGQELHLTTSTDTLTGGDGRDTFQAPLDTAIDGLVGAQTLQGSDVLDGGAGRDTLNVELNDTGTTQNPTIKNIEVINLTAFGAILGAGMASIDLARAQGYEELWDAHSRVDLEVTNVHANQDGNGPALGMLDVSDSEYHVVYDNAAVATQNVILDQVANADLDIRGVAGNIGTMNVTVQNGVDIHLEHDAADIENLVVSGSGPLSLDASGDFHNLQTLDTTGYDGDVDLDLGGSEDLTSVVTGDGDDRIEINHASINGDLGVDLGGGENVLAVDSGGWEALTATDVNGLDFTGGVTGVQTLAFDDDIALNGDATLNFAGFVDADGNSAPPATVDFQGVYDDSDPQLSGHPELSLANAAVDLTANFAGDVQDIELGTGNVVNLTANSTSEEFDVDNVNGPTLETLTINQTAPAGETHPEWYDVRLDVTSDADHNVSALQQLAVTTVGDADVDLDASSDDANINALTTINVIGGAEAELSMDGHAGVPATPDTIGGFTFTFDGGFEDTDSYLFGAIQQDATDRTVTLHFAGGVPDEVIQLGNGDTDNSHTADDIVAAIQAHYGADVSSVEAIDNENGSQTIHVSWADGDGPMLTNVEFGSHQDGYNIPIIGFDPGTPDQLPGLESVTNSTLPGDPAIPGSGFEGLQDVHVDAVTDAHVDLTDVYGAFTVDVSAGDDATVDLTHTAATSVTVGAVVDASVHLTDSAATVATIGAGNTADIDVDGAAHLGTITMSGSNVGVTLHNDLTGLTNVDVENATTHASVDSTDADVTAGLHYLVGSTSDGDANTNDVSITTNAANDTREIFQFVGNDIGDVSISGFDYSNATDHRDALDLSAFAHSAGDLAFHDNGSDTVITSADGQFDGSITLVGIHGHDAADVALHIMFA